MSVPTSATEFDGGNPRWRWRRVVSRPAYTRAFFCGATVSTRSSYSVADELYRLIILHRSFYFWNWVGSRNYTTVSFVLREHHIKPFFRINPPPHVSVFSFYVHRVTSQSDHTQAASRWIVFHDAQRDSGSIQPSRVPGLINWGR